jgi:POT family proton-dependent oligopeptide transporter
MFGFEIPAGWFQSLPAVFVIVFAPVFAALWVHLSRRGRNPSLVVKLAWGLILLAAGFLILVPGSQRALQEGKVWPTWLIFTYLLHVFGELLLSPVGLSSVTKLAPARLAGQMMGVWFLAASLGNLLAGLLAGGVSGARAEAMPVGFLQVAIGTGVAGLILLACARPVKKLMGGVQ